MDKKRIQNQNDNLEENKIKIEKTGASSKPAVGLDEQKKTGKKRLVTTLKTGAKQVKKYVGNQKEIISTRIVLGNKIDAVLDMLKKSDLQVVSPEVKKNIIKIFWNYFQYNKLHDSRYTPIKKFKKYADKSLWLGTEEKFEPFALLPNKKIAPTYTSFDDPKIAEDRATFVDFVKKYAQDDMYMRDPTALLTALEEYKRLCSMSTTESEYFSSLIRQNADDLKSVDKKDKKRHIKEGKFLKAKQADAVAFSLDMRNHFQKFLFSLGKISKENQDIFLGNKDLNAYAPFLKKIFTNADHTIDLKTFLEFSNFVQKKIGYDTKKLDDSLLSEKKFIQANFENTTEFAESEIGDEVSKAKRKLVDGEYAKVLSNLVKEDNLNREPSDLVHLFYYGAQLHKNFDEIAFLLNDRDKNRELAFASVKNDEPKQISDIYLREISLGGALDVIKELNFLRRVNEVELEDIVESEDETSSKEDDEDSDEIISSKS